jgi:ribonuclease BN (tRNA processing enzyme)
MATLTILGSGEAFDPLLPNTSLIYQGECTVLIDCGFSAIQPLWRQSSDPELLDAILLSHHHADHTFGVPALLMVMQAGGRQKPLTFIGTPGTKRYLTRLFDLAYTPGMARVKFPLEFLECAPGESIGLGPITIKTALPDHWITVLSTRWEVEGVPQFAYSADGKMTEATRELFKGVPVLVHECYGMPGREGPVHTHVAAVLALALASGAATLVLVHQASAQRAQIADYVRSQSIFGGQILIPDGVMRVRLG